ncbi:MAG: hypothetical protein ACYDBB_25155 [Armatimonadota bacterium]
MRINPEIELSRQVRGMREPRPWSKWLIYISVVCGLAGIVGPFVVFSFASFIPRSTFLSVYSVLPGVAQLGVILAIAAFAIGLVNKRHRHLVGEALACIGFCAFGCMLAFMFVPTYTTASRKAKDVKLQSNLAQIRSTITLFKRDTGTYPVSLLDMTAPATAGNIAGRTVVKKGSYLGPYFTVGGGIGGCGIPLNPYGNYEATTALVNLHWHYDGKTGMITSAVDGKTVDGIPFTKL